MGTIIAIKAVSDRLKEATFRDGKRTVALDSMLRRMVKARKLDANAALAELVEEGLRRTIAVARKDGEKWAGKQTHYAPRAGKAKKAAARKKAKKAAQK